MDIGGREKEIEGEKERHTDTQAYTYRDLDRQTDRQRNSTDTHTQRHNPHANADPGKTGGTEPPPPANPCPVKCHSYTPKMQTIFTLMLYRATRVSLAGL